MAPLHVTRTAATLSDPPVVISTYPDAGERGVYLNTLVKVTFNQNMLSSSISDTTFLLVKYNTYTPISATIEYDSGTRTATLTPDENLEADTTYIAIIVGNQDEHARTQVGVKNSSNLAMVGNYSWQFYTGFSVSSDPDVAALASGVTGYEEPQYPDPSGYEKSGYMGISWTEPENYDTNVPMSGTIIQIKLSDELEMNEFSGLGQMVVGEDQIDSVEDYLRYYITVSNTPSIGDSAVPSPEWEYDIYWNQSTCTVAMSGVPETQSINGYYNENGNYTQIATLYGMFQENSEYKVTVKAGLAGLNTYPLPADYEFIFTTTFDPLFSSVERIRLNIGPFIRGVPDDTINRLIHENSILAQRYYPTWAGLIEADDVPYYVTEFVTCKTKLDLLNSSKLEWAGAGSRKTLGDLTIERDGVGRDIVLLADGKAKELERCIYEMEQLVRTAGQKLSPDYAIIGKDDSRRPIKDSSWRRLPKLNPGATRRPGTAKGDPYRRTWKTFGRSSQTGRHGRFI